MEGKKEKKEEAKKQRIRHKKREGERERMIKTIHKEPQNVKDR